MVLKKQDKKDIREQFEFQEDLQSGSEKQLDEDFDRGRYSSEDDPQDLFQYKKMRLVPNSETDFRGLIDKDVVLANIKEKKPDPEVLRFLAETISLLRNVMVTKKRVIVTDASGKPLLEYDKSGKPVGYVFEEVTSFDEAFSPVSEALIAGFKYDHVSSRAMGDEREAKLDKTNQLVKDVRRRDSANGRDFR